MARSRFLPLLAGAAAVAVGVTGAIVGAQFAPAPAGAGTPEVSHIEVPVVASADASSPLPTGEELAQRDPREVITGVARVVEPGTTPEGALPADLAVLIGAMDAAIDPTEVRHEAEARGAAGGSGSGGVAGDPCADGGDGCPSGIPGIILPTSGGIPSIALVATGEPDAVCAAPEVRGSVRFPARVNAPATLSFRGTDGLTERTGEHTFTDAEIDAWFRDFREGDEAWLPLCVELSGFAGGADVTVELTAVALGGGSTAAQRVLVQAERDYRIPPARIETIGTSLVHLSAAHTSTEAVALRVLDNTDGLGCTYGAGTDARLIREVSPHSTETHSPQRLADAGYDPAYIHRSSRTFAVESSADLVACIGWFSTTADTSFDRSEPIRVSEVELNAPAITAPYVTLEDVDLSGFWSEDKYAIFASTGAGRECGEWIGAESIGSAPGTLLCDFDRLARYDVALGGLIITTELETTQGVARTDLFLPVGVETCGVDGCPGKLLFYDVPISAEIRTGPTCRTDCSIDWEQVYDTARISAAWPEVGPGNAEWFVGARYDGPRRTAADELPRMDTTARFEFAPVDGATRSVDAILRVRTDQNAAIEVLFEPAEMPARTPENCRLAGEWVASEFHTEHVASLPDLCAGITYLARVVVRDTGSGVATYAYGSPGENRWHGGRFTTPELDAPVHVNGLTLSTIDARPVAVDSMILTVAGARHPLLLGDDRCFADNVNLGPAGPSYNGVGEVIPVILTVFLRDVTIDDGVDMAAGPTSACTAIRGSGSAHALRFAGTITYEELLYGTELMMTDPASGWDASLLLHAYPAFVEG